MPKTDENREINLKGENLLERSLLQFCILNKFNDDFGIDYHADIIKNHNLQGDAFYIQLKSHQRIIQKNGYISETIDWDHLWDWGKRDLPVFLCLADISADKIYWVWIQEYLEKIRPKNNQKSHTIHASVTNEIVGNLPLFISRVCDSIAYSRSFAAVEKNTISNFKKKYPFFNLSVDYINGKERRMISNAQSYQTKLYFDEKNSNICLNHIPASPFHVCLTFLSDQQKRNFVRGEMGECNVSETSCPELFSRSGKYQVILNNIKHDTDAVLIIRDNKGYEIYRMDGFTGTYSHFQNYCGFKFSHPSKIITLDMFDDKLEFIFQYSYWDEYQVTELPYINIMASFFSMKELGYSAELSIHCDGQYVPVDFGEIPQSCTFIRNRLRYLLMANQVFRELGVTLKVKDFFQDLESPHKQENFFCILGTLWEKTWKKKMNKLLDMAVYFQRQRTVEVKDDRSLLTTITEEMHFFKWKIQVTTLVQFTNFESLPDNSGIYLSPTPNSEIIHKIKDVAVICPL